jgi:hypothetical protein
LFEIAGFVETDRPVAEQSDSVFTGRFFLHSGLFSCGDSRIGWLVQTRRYTARV